MRVYHSSIPHNTVCVMWSTWSIVCGGFSDSGEKWLTVVNDGSL